MTSSGMSIQRSALTSCSMRFIGKTGARSPGSRGEPSGLIGGFILMSAMMLYHCLGISLSSKKIFFAMVLSSAVRAFSLVLFRSNTRSHDFRKGNKQAWLSQQGHLTGARL